MSVHQALLEAQAQFPRLTRDGHNTHFGSSYVTLDHLLDEIRPVLVAHDLVLLQPLLVGSDNNPMLRTILHHVQTGSEVVSELPVAVPVGARAQELGSAITYSRRYAILALLALSTGDDDDGTAASDPAAAPTIKSPPPDANPPPRATEGENLYPEIPETTIHFGKNKGIPLRALTERQLRWYAAEWKGGGSAADEALHRALEIEMRRRGLE